MAHFKSDLDDKNIRFKIHFLEANNKEQIVRKVFNDYKEDEELYGFFLMSFINTNFMMNRDDAHFFFHNFGLKIVEPYLSKKLANKIENEKDKSKYEDLIEEVRQAIGFELDSVRARFMNCVNYVYNLRNDKRDEMSSYLTKFLAFSFLDGLDEFSLGGISIYQDINSKAKRVQLTSKNLRNITQQLENKELHFSLNSFYEVENIYSAAYLSLYELVANSNRRINVCENCGRYFVAKTKKEIYCDLPKYDGSRICREVAAKLKHSKLQEQDPVLHLYRKLYQQKITQIYREKDLKNKDNMKKSFDKWKNDAKPYLSQYKKKEIASAVLKKWLEENS